jgi:hypothetical protein
MRAGDESERTRIQKFAKKEPELTILTDHALKPEEAYLKSKAILFL